MRTDHLQWPFFDHAHRALAGRAQSIATECERVVGEGKSEADQVRALVARYGSVGLLAHAVVAPHGGTFPRLDVRSLAIIRETLAYHHGIMDFAFAMQGLGAGPISLAGSEALRSRYLPEVAAGRLVAAFALSERESGSNVADISTRATRAGKHWVLDGEKTWISNAGVADMYVIFARTGEGDGARGLSAFVVEADNPGLHVRESIALSSPHPLGTIRLDGCRVSDESRVGGAGDGFKVAMATLDVFRSTVGAAAVGFARRALDLTVAHVRARRVFDQALSEFQMTQGTLAEMAADVDTSALAVYRAAWTKDNGAARVTREAAMAKLVATEQAQRVIDRAVQLHGGLGVVAGHPVERLYRDIRPLRIYEGTSEIQKIIIARDVLRAAEETDA